MSIYDILPRDIFQYIIILCDLLDILNLSCVNHRFNTIIDSSLWKRTLEMKYPSDHLFKYLTKNKTDWKRLALSLVSNKSRIITISDENNKVSYSHNGLGLLVINREDTYQMMIDNVRRIYPTVYSYFTIINDVNTTMSISCDNNGISSINLPYNTISGIYLSQEKSYRIKLYVKSALETMLDPKFNMYKHFHAWFTITTTMKEITLDIEKYLFIKKSNISFIRLSSFPLGIMDVSRDSIYHTEEKTLYSIIESFKRIHSNDLCGIVVLTHN